jgi:hypothetical protein
MKPEFTLKLMRWNRNQNKRPMPWKGEKDPYKIWLSEVILQQTRVEQGWSYYQVPEFQLSRTWRNRQISNCSSFGKGWVIPVAKTFMQPLNG